MTKIRVLGALTVVLALAGCAGEAGGDVPTASGPAPTSAAPVATETATASATPTATATPTPTGKPALADLLLSSEGLGYVKVGSVVPNVPTEQQIVRWKENFCGFTGDGPKPGAYKTLYPTIHEGNLAFFVENGAEKSSPVKVIYILSDEIHTKHGLRVGSSLADVKKLGGKNEGGDDYSGDAWVIHGSAGELVFWFDDKDVVTNIQVQKEGSKPVLALEITPCD